MAHLGLCGLQTVAQKQTDLAEDKEQVKGDKATYGKSFGDVLAGLAAHIKDKVGGNANRYSRRLVRACLTACTAHDLLPPPMRRFCPARHHNFSCRWLVRLLLNFAVAECELEDGLPCAVSTAAKQAVQEGDREEA